MSLFGDPLFRWRETFMVLFVEAKRPTVDDVEKALARVGKFDSEQVNEIENGLIESLTVTNQIDCIGLDIVYVDGEETLEQLEELQGQISPEDLLPGQEELLEKLPACTARLDILHFEQLTASMTEDDAEEFLDPGALLGVAEALAQLVDGVAVDPGTGTFV
ncbi:MAG: hypothetical protein CMJ76_08695 [Planctomycetaceae bacterium]|nr:hypothetical protein [Planctomycetaceae bacterium]